MGEEPADETVELGELEAPCSRELVSSCSDEPWVDVSSEEGGADVWEGRLLEAAADAAEDSEEAGC